MDWFEKKIVAPLDRKIRQAEEWWDAAPTKKKVFAFACALVFLGLLIELTKIG